MILWFESGLDASIIPYDEVIYIICVYYAHNRPKLPFC